MPRLREVRPRGKAAQFVAVGDRERTFFLELHAPGQGDGLLDGDLLAVSEGADAEPGDLVVWWYGSPSTQALARVAGNLSLQPVAGFPPPERRPLGASALTQLRRGTAVHDPVVRGVVVGRLRRMDGGQQAEAQ